MRGEPCESTVPCDPADREIAGDFRDYYIAVTGASLAEALRTRGFKSDVCVDRFLPYTMANGRQYPTGFLRAYLKLPLAGRFFGKQFLVVGVQGLPS